MVRASIVVQKQVFAQKIISYYSLKFYTGLFICPTGETQLKGVRLEVESKLLFPFLQRQRKHAQTICYGTCISAGN